jgi:hypothetical protein
MLRFLDTERFNTYRLIHANSEGIWKKESEELREKITSAEAIPDQDEEYLTYLGEQLAEVEDYTAVTHRYALLQSIWGFFEERLNALCHEIHRDTKFPFKVDELLGAGVVRAVKYIQKVGEIEIKKDSQQWQYIVSINKLRNIITHSDGRVRIKATAENEDDWAWEPCNEHKAIVDFLEKEKIGHLDMPYIKFEFEFIPFVINLLETFLFEIYEAEEKLRPNTWHFPELA